MLLRHASRLFSAQIRFSREAVSATVEEFGQLLNTPGKAISALVDMPNYMIEQILDNEEYLQKIQTLPTSQLNATEISNWFQLISLTQAKGIKPFNHNVKNQLQEKAMDVMKNGEFSYLELFKTQRMMLTMNSGRRRDIQRILNEVLRDPETKLAPVEFEELFSALTYLSNSPLILSNALIKFENSVINEFPLEQACRILRNLSFIERRLNFRMIPMTRSIRKTLLHINKERNKLTRRDITSLLGFFSDATEKYPLLQNVVINRAMEQLYPDKDQIQSYIPIQSVIMYLKKRKYNLLQDPDPVHVSKLQNYLVQHQSKIKSPHIFLKTASGMANLSLGQMNSELSKQFKQRCLTALMKPDRYYGRYYTLLCELGSSHKIDEKKLSAWDIRSKLNIYSDLLYFKQDNQATEIGTRGFENLTESVHNLSEGELYSLLGLANRVMTRETIANPVTENFRKTLITLYCKKSAVMNYASEVTFDMAYGFLEEWLDMITKFQGAPVVPRALFLNPIRSLRQILDLLLDNADKLDMKSTQYLEVVPLLDIHNADYLDRVRLSQAINSSLEAEDFISDQFLLNQNSFFKFYNAMPYLLPNIPQKIFQFIDSEKFHITMKVAACQVTDQGGCLPQEKLDQVMTGVKIFNLFDFSPLVQLYPRLRRSQQDHLNQHVAEIVSQRRNPFESISDLISKVSAVTYNNYKINTDQWWKSISKYIKQNPQNIEDVLSSIVLLDAGRIRYNFALVKTLIDCITEQIMMADVHSSRRVSRLITTFSHQYYCPEPFIQYLCRQMEYMTSTMSISQILHCLKGFTRFGIYNREYFMLSAEIIKEQNSAKYLPLFACCVADVGAYNNDWVQEAIQHQVKQDDIDEFTFEGLALSLWGSYISLGGSHQIIDKLVEQYKKPHRDLLLNRVRRLQMNHLIPNLDSEEQRQQLFDIEKQLNSFYTPISQMDTISTALRRQNVAWEPYVEHEKLSVPFYLPEYDTVLWPNVQRQKIRATQDLHSKYKMTLELLMRKNIAIEFVDEGQDLAKLITKIRDPK